MLVLGLDSGALGTFYTRPGVVFGAAAHQAGERGALGNVTGNLGVRHPWPPASLNGCRMAPARTIIG